VQDKLREELDTKLYKKGEEEEMDYDVLNGLVYLDMFLCGKKYYANYIDLH